MSSWCLTEPVWLCLGIESTGHAGTEIQLMLIHRTPPRRVDLACYAFVVCVEKTSVKSVVITSIYEGGQSSQQKAC